MKNNFYTMEDLFHAVAPFGSMDANALLERCNEWGIHPADVVEYAQDNYEYSPKADDFTYNINVLFDALFYIRIQKLNIICDESIEVINELLFDLNNGNNGYLSNQNLEYKTLIDGRELIFKERLEKLKNFLENNASEHIHINEMCSCFDNTVLSNLDSVINSDDLLFWLEKTGDFDVNN